MTTLLEGRLETAQRAMAAFASTAETGSTTTQLVDARLRDVASSPDAFSGGFIYRPDATNSTDRLRALPGSGAFATQAGALTPIRAWTVAPAAEERYQLFALLPPTAQPGQTEDWTRIVNRALGHLYTVADLPVGSGGAGARIFPIAPPVVTLYAAVAVAGGSGASVTLPTGWTLVTSVDLSATLKLVVASHRLLASDPIDFDFTLDSSRAATGVLVAYVDANPTSPTQTSASTSSASASSLAIPTVTTAQAAERVLRIIASATPAAFTVDDDPATVQKRIDALESSGEHAYGLAVFDSTVSAAGAAGAVTVAPSTAPVGMIGVTVALDPRTELTRTVYASSSVASNGTDDTLTLRRPVNLPSDEWTPNKQAIRRVVVRTYSGDVSDGVVISELDMKKSGRDWRYLVDGSIQLVGITPSAQQQVVLEVQRPYPPLVTDGDETDCPLERLLLRSRYEAFAALNSAPQTRGKYQQEMDSAYQEWLREDAHQAPQQVIIRP